MKPFSILTHSLIAGSALIIFSSCNSKQPTKTPPEKKPTQQKVVTWDWKAFPRANELTLRTLPVSIQPKRSFEIKSEANGIITLEIDKKISNVKKGQILARMDVETLNEEAEKIRIETEKQILEEMKDEKLTIPEKRKKAQEELTEAKRKVKLITMILKNPAMKEMSMELFGQDIGKVNEAALAKAKADLRLAEQKFAWAEEFDEKLRKGELRLKEMAMNKNKRKFKEVKDRSVYTIPFDGELRLEVNFIKDKKEYTVGGRETIATLNDYQEIYAYVKVANASWINLQPQRLYIQLNDRSKTLMNFHDERIIRDKRTRKEERKYIFSVPLKNNESLKRLAGTEMKAQLIYKLPETCYIVPKYDLSLYSLGKTNTTDWQEMVKQLWPTAKVLAQGRKHLAIKF